MKEEREENIDPEEDDPTTDLLAEEENAELQRRE
jgi:hypothetical protein